MCAFPSMDWKFNNKYIPEYTSYTLMSVGLGMNKRAQVCVYVVYNQK